MQMTPQKMPTFAAASQLLLCRLCLPPSVTGLQNSLNMKRDTTSQGEGGVGDVSGCDGGGVVLQSVAKYELFHIFDISVWDWSLRKEITLLVIYKYISFL